MHIQLMTDSSADIPAFLSEKLDVKVVPLYLHFSDGQYTSGVTMGIEAYHKKVKDLGELPRSAAPSPHNFYEEYKKIPADKPIIMLSLSSALSSTYDHALAGKELLLEEEPNRVIEVINTKTASCGISLLLHEAGKKLEEGYSFDHLVEHLHERVEQTTTLFVLKTLENLVLGGRLEKMKGRIAKTLNIKILMKATDEGEIEVAEKVRGDKKSIRRFIDQIGEYTKNTESKIISMTHCRDEDRANSVLKEIRNKYHFKDALLAETGPLISTYGGEGALVMAFFKDKDK
ncbi:MULTISPECIES: DegV family protein [Oceanobacillus]|uniref:Fatty acid-binding protein DegV n=1 Tax=Oceanobacillus kimchii TaxID=746691 RepID=A0ABQ5TDU5_9BACI|nr:MULTISPECIES: DegV family protein [Oceanobacillus]MBT2652798.1 DegV family protein [Oceanobacillus sp. ISL-73]OEH53547.1 fatty acid-binding protein DegV [Oceanobacillus sp. E9]GLO64941.1 fatty acid-binding protein DegV [Oceanobacillus kimchii]